MDFDVVIETVPAPEYKYDYDKDNKQNLIEKLLSILNPDQRACVLLREIEGYLN